MDKKYIYEGNVEITEVNYQEWQKKLKGIKKITGDLSINSNAKLDALKTVGGYLSIYSNAKLDALKTVGGGLYINSKIEKNTEEGLWKNNHNNEWYLTDKCSEWLLSQKGKIKYRINNIQFEKELFDKVRKDKLSAQEVFSLENIEQRRVAYEKMDKLKMKELSDYKILEETKDDYGNPMKVIEFSLPKYNIPFRYLNCICPTTKREYFVETKKKECIEAKMASFGLDKTIKFDKEW